MTLDDELCYQAITSRDARFDGRFFAAVITTRIYCRSVCPVPAARPENLRWFTSAVAAEAAGFRPCRRCRPDALPGTPAWLGSASIVKRGLRLIGEGALDDGDVEKLATRLGIGARQLRRLFRKHVGTSPVAIAIARRAHFAATLLTDTDLSITQVGLAAGFNSIREFNEIFRATFGESPTEYRPRHSRRSAADAPAAGRGLIVRLSFRPPLDWSAIIRFLQRQATPGVEVAGLTSYRRTFELNGRVGTIEVRPVEGASHLLMRVQLPAYGHVSQVIERARRVFDLDADPVHITRQLRRSPELRSFVERSPGLRVPGAWDTFELAVRAVLGQRLTAPGAVALAGKLVASFGRAVNLGDRQLTHLFPPPSVLAEADLSRIGVPQRQAETIRRLATALASNKFSFDAIENSVNEVQLGTFPGIGPGTAAYIVMRGLADPDVFPADDLRLCRALADRGNPLSVDELARRGAAWRPWRAYAAMYLASVDP